MSSSLREIPLDVTLARAKEIADELGISRVTDITRLDRIGIPVFASVRPGACEGSLCVNAGKGLRPKEAEVGAFMEAIEFAVAEFGRRNIPIVTATPRIVSAQKEAEFRFVDFCPMLRIPIDPDGPLDCVFGEDMITGRSLLVPAELAFFPYLDNCGQRLFGSSTNGLCSGNSVEEACVHGLSEVMERDIQSFNNVKDSSIWIETTDLPRSVEQLLHLVREAGLDIVMRYTPNPFGMAYVQSFIIEPDNDFPVTISHGSGLHPIREVAAVRAVSEAAQSRLSYIHGGRDDLIDRTLYFQGQPIGVETAETARLRARVYDQSRRIPYNLVPDHSPRINSLSDATSALLEALRAAGIGQVLRVRLSKANSKLSVVKVIVPKLESFEHNLRRVGPRLSDYLAGGCGDDMYAKASPVCGSLAV